MGAIFVKLPLPRDLGAPLGAQKTMWDPLLYGESKLLMGLTNLYDLSVNQLADDCKPSTGVELYTPFYKGYRPNYITFQWPLENKPCV